MVRLWAIGLVALVGSAASAAPTTSDLLTMKDVLAPALSPDGRQVAYRIDQADLAGNRRSVSWWVAPTDGSAAPRRISQGGTAIWLSSGAAQIEAPIWAPDGRSIYYRALVDGAVQVWRASAGRDHVTLVTRDPADVRTFRLSPDGRGIDYVVGAAREEITRAERDSYDAGVVVDDRVDLRQSLFGAVEINGRLASQRLSGRWFQRGGLLENAPTTTWRVERAAANRRPVDTSSPDNIRRSLDGYGAVAAGGPLRLEALAAETPRACRASACQDPSARLVGWRRGAPEIVFVTTDSLKRQTLNVWSLATDTVRRLYGGDSQLADALNPSCTVGADRVVCVETAPALPPRLVALDLSSGAKTVLDAPNAAWDFSDVEVRPMTWSAGGRDFSAVLIQPKGAPAQPRPLFIYYYYCDGFLRGGEGDVFPLYPIASAGIATLCINRSPPAPGEEALAEYRTALAGVSAVVERLVGEGLVDRQKVGMGGFSFGSEIAMWVAANSDLLAVATINSSQLEPSYYWFNGVRGRDNHTVLKAHWDLGDPDQDPADWRRMTPAKNVASISAPVLLQLPEQEARSTVELFARLSISTTPAELVAFPNEPHIFTQPRHRFASYERTLDWLGFWLQDRVDPAPAKAAQYARWRDLRRRATPAPVNGTPKIEPTPQGP